MKRIFHITWNIFIVRNIFNVRLKKDAKVSLLYTCDVTVNVTDIVTLMKVIANIVYQIISINLVSFYA